MLGLGALASRAFNQLLENVSAVNPVVWGSRGGIGKKRKEEIKKSQRAEMQEHVKTLFEEPAVIEAVQEIKEEIKEYVKPSQGFSVHSIDYGKLARNVELMERIIAKVQEMKQEQEDEEMLLMLM